MLQISRQSHMHGRGPAPTTRTAVLMLPGSGASCLGSCPAPPLTSWGSCLAPPLTSWLGSWLHGAQHGAGSGDTSIELPGPRRAVLALS